MKNEYRSLTAEEFADIAPALEKCHIVCPEDVSRFVDTKLRKTYDVYLLRDGAEKKILKKCDAINRDVTKYQRYFAGHDFAVPRVLRSFSLDDHYFVEIEFVDGDDARECSESDAAKIGVALAQIQSYYLTDSGNTEVTDRYFKKCVLERYEAIKDYFPGSEKVLSYVQRRFFEAPQTLIHDDLLPINVFAGEGDIRIIDWEYADILPYFLDLGRFAFVYDCDSKFFISHDSAMSFLRSYYEKMLENPAFSVSRQQFYLDVAVSAFCQYTMFLSYEEDKDKLLASPDYRYLRNIIDYIKSTGI